MRRNDSRIFPMLTLLFPNSTRETAWTSTTYFPRAGSRHWRLDNAGVEEDRIEEFRDHCNRIANFQLLDRTVNNEKRATLPAEWLDIHRPNDEDRRFYCERHLLGDVPREITGFEELYSARREKLKERIAQLVNVS